MATTNGFQSLDELDAAIPTRRTSTDDVSFLDRIDLGAAIAESKRISANTADKAYRRLTSHGNVTSYSLLGNLHECPRRFELDKLQANAEVPLDVDVDPAEVNIDFAFGHAVGAGIQTYAVTHSILAAQWAAFCAWRAPWDAEKLDKNGKATAGKSLTLAMAAVENFIHFWDTTLSDFEVVVINGKPAVELAFAVDMQNGFWHFGHIDAILRSKSTGRLAVWEGKTTAFENVNEAAYGNSSQALGYSVVVDAIAQIIGAEGSDYEVFYIVFSSKSREFMLLPFGKSRKQRAEWIQDILLDHANIGTYERIQFYPKRGESCINKYRRQCYWYGQCHMSNKNLFPGTVAPELKSVENVEAVDFKFTRDELIASQKQKG